LPDYLWAEAESGNEPFSDTVHQVRLRLADVSRVFVHGPCSAFNMLVIVQAVHTGKWRDQVVLWTRLETEADALEACNKIETLAKHDVVLVIDNALVHPDWIARLHSIWKRNKVKSSLIVMARSSIEGGGPFEGREWAEDAIQTIVEDRISEACLRIILQEQRQASSATEQGSVGSVGGHLLLGDARLILSMEIPSATTFEGEVGAELLGWVGGDSRPISRWSASYSYPTVAQSMCPA